MNWNNTNRNLPIIKLPNGVFYIFDRMFNSIEANHSLFFAMYGVKSKGTTLVIDYDTTTNFSYSSISRHLMEKNLKHFDRIFIRGAICINGGAKKVFPSSWHIRY